jgi:hypothetical protein
MSVLVAAAPTADVVTLTLLSSLFGGGVCATVVFFLLKTWIKTRLEASIKHEYDAKLEEFKFEIRKREQSALVAELFSKWIHVDESKIPNVRELNRLSFEISLWLPDEVAVEIGRRLKNLQNAKPAQDLLAECRKIIQGKDTKLRPEDITFFG